MAKVTPCVGVWIETFIWVAIEPCTPSHPAWVCGLKRIKALEDFRQRKSHPAWVCGLKPVTPIDPDAAEESHPAWVCGLKPCKMGCSLC